MSSGARKYAGVEADARAKARRAAMLAAGIEVIGAAGWPGLTVKSVCVRSGVTERYFYQEFRGLQQFCVAVVEHVADDTVVAIESALGDSSGEAGTRLRAVLVAVWRLLLDDVDRGRVAAMEAVGDAELLRLRNRIEARFETLLIEHGQRVFGPELSELRVRVAAIALVGAADELFRRMLAGEVEVDLEEAADQLVTMFGSGLGGP